MPRVYKPDPLGRRYKKYSQELIEQAVQEYKKSPDSLGSIAKKFEICKSVLYRHSLKSMKTQGGQTVLSNETEMEFVKYINICAEWGYPLHIYDVRLLVKNHLDKTGVTEKRFKNNMPGPDYASRFLKRHNDKLSKKISLNIKRNRVMVSDFIIKEYYDHLNNSVQDIPVENIINFGEINLDDDFGRKKITTKYPERIMNPSKGPVTLMMGCTASGEILPPYIVNKAKNIYDTWVLSGLKEARYNRSPTGWIDATIFEDWMTSIIFPYFENKSGKKCLIGDNLSFHISIDLIKKCQERDIHFVLLPASSSHITQPLNVAIFPLLKTTWRNIKLQWKNLNRRSQALIHKDCFPKLLCHLMKILEENNANIVVEGFEKTGIHPFDPKKVLTKLLDKNRDENADSSIEAVFVKEEIQHKIDNVVECQIKNKSKVKTGKTAINSAEIDLINENTAVDKMTKIVAKGKGIGKKTNVKKKDFEDDSFLIENLIDPIDENSFDNDKKNTENASLSVEGTPCCSTNTSFSEIKTIPVIFNDDQNDTGNVETDVKNKKDNMKTTNNIEDCSYVLVKKADLMKLLALGPDTTASTCSSMIIKDASEDRRQRILLKRHLFNQEYEEQARRQHEEDGSLKVESEQSREQPAEENIQDDESNIDANSQTKRPKLEEPEDATSSEVDESDDEVKPEDNAKKPELELPESTQIIANVFRYLKEEYKYIKIHNEGQSILRPLSMVRRRTAKATGVTKTVVKRIVTADRERIRKRNMARIVKN